MSVFIQKAPNLIDIINKNRDDIDNILNKINSIYNNIDLLDNVVSAPLISYPSQAIYGSTVTLKASSSITAFKDNGAILDTYIWELPDSSTIEGDTITYTMPDSNHIGETVTIKCRAKDILGNYSKYSNIDILVNNIDDTPIIDGIMWSENNHMADSSYVLTINAHDPNGDNLTYELIAIDDNITISQDTTNPNIFTIDYPGYPMDIVINYTIKVTDTHNATATFIENKLVHYVNHAPIIDNTTWDDSNHYENGSYTLTINAHDPDIGDTLSYNVICNDTNVTVTQDATNPNIFHITYPEYTNDVTIIYNITVTDHDGLSATLSLNQLVHYVNHPPVIDSIVWDDSNHYENESYTLTITAHDPDSGDNIIYTLICSDSNVSITQDATNLNQFHVTYPEYTNNTVVTYTITVTDNHGDSVNTTLSQIVQNINHAPVIDSTTWDDSNHYENGSYTLTITAHDPDVGDTITYSVTCDDTNVTVTQDATNPNIFTVTYPEYINDTVVTYTITVTDNFGANTDTIITQLVHNINHDPIIDNIAWDDSNHYENGSYTLTITAHDPDSGDSVDDYTVTCSDTNVTVTQNATNPNIFHVTYPEYTNDVTVTYTITVSDTFGDSTITTLSQLVQNINHPPVIDSVTWNNTNHYENNSYTLTIAAHDPDSGDSVSYSVTCDDTNVTITQNNNNPYIFTITYPEYTNDTVVTYTITVTDNFGATDSVTTTQLVQNINHDPIIDSTTWDDSNHYENGSYTLTINAHDPDSGDNITYSVSCDDTNVTITQDSTNSNIFHVTYPEYTIDVTVTYTVTVTDTFGATSSTTLTQLVHNNNHTPIIDSTSWDDDDHYENGSYTLTITAHDPDSGDTLNYTVTCDDANVTITQDSTYSNIFHITYPEYINDVTVTYIVTVTDSFGATDTITITKLVHNTNHPPIITNVIWNDTNHYENGSYILTISAYDPDSGDSIDNYSITCDDNSVTIVQNNNNPNIFTVTYPEYTNDVTVTYTVTVTDSFGAISSTTLTQLVHNNNQPPVIDSTSWDDSNHYENGSYILTITAHDPDVGDSITYSVSCNDPNVTVTQDSTYPNQFHITYPEYTIDTTVTYTVTVTDSFGATDSTTLSQLVHNDNQLPVIDSTSWDDSNHYENGSYILTINAHDPDSGDSITNYTVTCSDTNVTITQDSTYPNQFHITYPEYTIDTTVTYTVTVTDSFGATSSTTLTQLVHNNNHTPIIDSTTWDNNTHHENESYVLTITAHDPDSGDSITNYTVTCSDTNVTITQDSTYPNQFHITYPEYTIDTTVTYTVTVTDSFGATSSTTLTQLVYNNNQPPIIDSTIWNDDIHYEQGSYSLTINAHDPDSGDSIDSYDVSCDDINVSIMQDGANPNIFYIDYPEYTDDTTVTYTITVTDTFGAISSTTTTKLVHNNNQPPIIDDFMWDDDMHYEQGSYTLTIDAHDPDSGDSIDYDVSCDDINVSIMQDGANPNIFYIDYPEYTDDTTVTYTITVTDNFGATDSIITTKLVYNNNQSPIIDDFMWDDDMHYEQGSYTLTIDAHDPDSGDSIDYDVSCDDINVSIMQDGANPNIFYIDYPEYDNDVTVTYTITVTDSFGATDSTITTQLVYNVNHDPVIDNISWDNNTHYEQGSYILTIDAYDPDSGDNIDGYDVICDEGSVSITQDSTNPNQFHIDYPHYSSDITVTYTITVIDTFGAIDSTTISQLVYNKTGDRGVFGGGYNGSDQAIIDYIAISNLGNASSFGNLTLARHDLAATSNGTNDRGVFGGGVTFNTIDYITISALGDALDFGDLTVTRSGLAATSNNINNRGVFGGGWDSTNRVNTIDYITISTLGDAQDFGDLTIARAYFESTSNSTNDRGVFAGGNDSSIYNIIDYVTISTLGDAQDFGDLTLITVGGSATSNGTNNRGVFGGGWDESTLYNVISYITISTLGNAQDFGDLTISRRNPSATSNGTNDRGIFDGGWSDSSTFFNTIDYITISTLGDALDFGDLTVSRFNAAATANA